MGNSKVYTIFAGINGAGKSTLYNSLDKKKFGVRLNSDEEIQKLGLDWANINNQGLVAKKVLQLQEDCFNRGVSMNRETTLSGLLFLRTVKRAKELGYKIDMYYIDVEDINIAKQRVLNRVNMGGHGINEKMIDDRFKTIRKNLVEFIPYCDNIHFYDNSSDHIELIAYKHNGKIEKTRDDCKWLEEVLSEYERKNGENFFFDL